MLWITASNKRIVLSFKVTWRLTDLVLLWRLLGGVGQHLAWLNTLCSWTAPLPMYSKWEWLWWLCWMLWAQWELKQWPSSKSDWTTLDSGVSASGGREMSSGDAHSYSSLERKSSVIASWSWSSTSDRPSTGVSWVKCDKNKAGWEPISSEGRLKITLKILIQQD